MFLSLVALQFTFNFPPASRLNAIQQLVVACYCVIGVNSLAHLLVYFLARWQDRHTRCDYGQPHGAQLLTIGTVAAAWPSLHLKPATNKSSTAKHSAA